MPSSGTLTEGSQTGSIVVWAGGQGLLSISGPMRGDKQPCVVILESDETGDYEPIGDVILHTSPSKIAFCLPAINLRPRINGADATTDVDTFIN